MEQLSDTELVALYRKGTEAALSILIQRHIASVYRFLYRMVGDRHLAEDMTQDTFVKVWRNLSKFEASKSFTTWMFTIAKNTSIDGLRKKDPIAFSKLENEDVPDFAATIPDEQPLPSTLLERAELAAVLEEALEKLPHKARSVVILHQTEELTFQEIAETLGEPLNTVKSRYRRATESLRKYLTGRLE